MEKVPKKGRGPSDANKRAERFYMLHPGMSAKELSKKFKIDLSTIYRAPWWKKSNKGAAQ